MGYLVELLMPKLHRHTLSGEIEQWFKREGQLVRKGESLAEVREGNRRTVCRASDHGVLVEIVAQEGRPITAGEVIARLEFNGEEVQVEPWQEIDDGAWDGDEEEGFARAQDNGWQQEAA